MASYEYDLPDDMRDDADARYERDQQAEHVEAREERLREERAHRTDWRPVKRVKRSEAPKPPEDDRWREEIFARDQGCVAHSNPQHCTLPPQFHHVIDQKTLRRLGHTDALWDRRIGVCVCFGAHVRHTTGAERIPLEALPSEVVSFVEDLGLRYLLDRYYPQRTEEAA